MSEYTPDEEQVREQYTQEQPPQIGSVAEKRAEFDRFVARIKSEALRELLDEATSVKDGHGHVESCVPEWAVRDELDRIEKEAGL